MSNKIYLFDQDGVIANFEEYFLDRWLTKYPGRFHVPLHERKGFYTTDDYPEEHHEDIWAIQQEQHFFRNMPPIPGAIEAFREMKEIQLNVFICTSPILRNVFCASEKIEWIKEHLGIYWAARTHITKDKTMVRGDILVDDRPSIEGDLEPTWEHVLFTTNTNINITGKRRVTWENWRTIL